MVKKCLDCQKLIDRHSKRCRSCASKGKNNPMYGKRIPEESIRRGENSPQWKGAKVSYGGLHLWVSLHKGAANKCEQCGITSKDCRIEWANKDHKYRRKLEDFISLCVYCHYKYDKKRGLNTYRPAQSLKTGKFIKKK